MAANDTAALVVALSAQLTKFEKDMDKAVGVADKSARHIENRFQKINPHADLEGFIGDLQKLAAAGGLAEIIRSVVDLNEQLAKIGDKAETVGLTTDEFQKFRYAVVATGGSIDTADTFLTKFSNNIAEAAKGQGNLYNFLRVNNVALRDNNGQLLPANTLLEKYADLVKNTKSPQEQLNEAFMVGGKQAGPELVQALKNGAEGLREFGIEAENAGVVIDAALIERAKKANEQFAVTKLKATVIFEEAANAVVEEFQKKNAEMNQIGQGWADSLKKGWDSFLDYVSKNFPQVGEAVSSSVKQIQAAAQMRANADRQTNFSAGADLLKGGQGQSIGDLGKFPGYHPTSVTVDVPTKQYNAQADAFDKLMKAQEGRIRLLNAERIEIGLNVGAATEMTEKINLENQLKQQNIPLTAARQAAIDAEAKKIGQAAQALDDYKRQWAGLNASLQFAGDEAINVIDGLRNHTLTAGDAVNQLANSFIHAAEQAMLLGSGPLATLFGTQSSVPGGTGGIIGAFAGLFRAGGGPVSGGQPYIVGERGPELFVPGGSGNIVPNNVMSKSAGGGGINVYVTSAPVFQAGMTPTDMAAIEARLQDSNAQLRQQVQADLRANIRNDADYLAH